MVDIPSRIIFVCTANQNRSVFAHHAAVQLGLRPAWLADCPIESRGTSAVDNNPPLPESVRAASRLGVDIASHRSLKLTVDDMNDAWIIGMDKNHIDVKSNAWRKDLLGSFANRGAIADPMGYPESFFDTTFESILSSLKFWARQGEPQS